jgi:hypothetical protein
MNEPVMVRKRWAARLYVEPKLLRVPALENAMGSTGVQPRYQRNALSAHAKLDWNLDSVRGRIPM